MKKNKLILLSTLAITLLSSCNGGGGGGRAGKTQISIYNFSGGVGGAWLDSAIAEFSELHAETEFEEGKKGVYISYWGNTHSAGALGTMKSSGDAIFFTEKGSTPYTLANQETLYNLNDLFASKADESENRTIEDKIDDDYLSALKGADGNYYALPHYEWYSGLTYDITAFDNDGVNSYYFAAPEETNIYEFEAKKTVGKKTYNFGTGRFLVDDLGKKSCGNDGLYGTEDDGLPSSVEEFLILCTYLDSQGLAPLAVAGNHRDYSAYLLQGFLSSLLGSSGIHDFYDFDGSVKVVKKNSQGKIQFVEGEELFSEGSGIPAPQVETVQVTEETGYLMRETYERYYLAGLMNILVDCDFFTDKSVNSSATNFQTQEGFIMSRPKATAAMLIEGNYWYNEAKNQGYFESYKKAKGYERNIGWMSLPTKLTGSVEEDKSGIGYKSTLIDTAYSYCFVNKSALTRKEKTEGYRTAVLEFVKFLYTDRQLENFSRITGTAKAALDYNVTSDFVFDELSTFQKQVLTLKKNNGVAYSKAVNETFKAKQLEFQFGIEAPIWKCKVGGTTYNEYITAFRDPNNPNVTPADVMEGSFISPDIWMSSYYKGN